MKLFHCSNCDNPLYFENTRCLACNSEVGFHTRHLAIITLRRTDDNEIFLSNDFPEEKLRFCSNRQTVGCNWLVNAGNGDGFCVSCKLNKTIPNLSEPDNITRWQHLEAAKKRLIYSLMKLKLPFRRDTRSQDRGLQFEFLSSDLAGKPVMTGHLDGLITINIEEADEIQRHLTRIRMRESYRTVLGHFRHETGHYYWNRLVRDFGMLSSFRALFGNEEANYTDAIEKYYREGPSHGWQESFISEYACAHPWEDWAETFAHYLHVTDSLETAWSFGLQLTADKSDTAGETTGDPYEEKDFRKMIAVWLPLSIAMNNMNRSMGHNDFYSFYLSARSLEKLSFVHQLCRQWKSQFS